MSPALISGGTEGSYPSDSPSGISPIRFFIFSSVRPVFWMINDHPGAFTFFTHCLRRRSCGVFSREGKPKRDKEMARANGPLLYHQLHSSDPWEKGRLPSLSKISSAKGRLSHHWLEEKALPSASVERWCVPPSHLVMQWRSSFQLRSREPRVCWPFCRW